MKLQPTMLGLTLLEQLLTLSITLALLTYSVRHFPMYTLLTQRHLVQDDLMVLHHALHHYFYQHGCDLQGRFRGNPNPSLDQLGLTPLSNGRAPWISSYEISLLSVPISPQKKCQAIARISAQLTAEGMKHRISLLGLAADGEYQAPQQIRWQARLTPNACLSINPLTRRYQP